MNKNKEIELFKEYLNLTRSKPPHPPDPEKIKINEITYYISDCDFYSDKTQILSLNDLRIKKIRQIIIEYDFELINDSNFNIIKNTIDEFVEKIVQKYPNHTLNNYKGNYKPYRNLLIPTKLYQQLNN
jgi:hypothetical protein